MVNEPDNVTLARLEERLRTIFENQTREAREREKMEESIKQLSESINDLSARVQRVEESITKSEPTIEEFITIKHKVVGAGIFGKWVWLGAGAVIGLVASARREIFAWFAG